VPKKIPTLAKLSRPRLYDALPRERLFALLDSKREHPAVWIAGPPGSGKTTLVCSYLEDRRLRGIWYQVDAGDGDLSTFFYYLTEAAKAFPSKKPLPLLTPEYSPDLPGFTRRYFRELFLRLPDDGVVVLDNFHAADQGAMQQIIAIAVLEGPGSMASMVISREQPLVEFSPRPPPGPGGAT
jgi:ATP/maltotriose-dependent transcriptional regulator MalT